MEQNVSCMSCCFKPRLRWSKGLFRVTITGKVKNVAMKDSED